LRQVDEAREGSVGDSDAIGSVGGGEQEGDHEPGEEERLANGEEACKQHAKSASVA
jgi:hypothetical protein